MLYGISRRLGILSFIAAPILGIFAAIATRDYEFAIAVFAFFAGLGLVLYTNILLRLQATFWRIVGWVFTGKWH